MPGKSVFAIFLTLIAVETQAQAQEAAHAQCTAIFASNFSSLPMYFHLRQTVADRMLDNISPYIDRTDHSKGIYRGMVTAADSVYDPTQGTPNYEYQWIRDAGITITMLVDSYLDETDPVKKTRILQILMDHMAVIKRFQETANRSGQPGIVQKDGTTEYYRNLGETKINLDGSQAPPWMNPQVDGPAYSLKGLLRLTDIIWDDWSNLLDQKLSLVRTDLKRSDIYSSELDSHGNQSILKRYFEFLIHNWNDKSYDAWEEEHGSHFATLAAIQAVLIVEGPEFTARIGDPGAGDEYKRVGMQIEDKLKTFWDSSRRVVRPSLDVDYSNLGHGDTPAKTRGIDSQVVIGFAHSKSPTFHPVSDMVLSTIYEQEMIFKDQYPVNHGQKVVLIGRYPEDIYSGAPGVLKGQPWFLTTLYFAEMAYKSGAELYNLGELQVTNLNIKMLNYMLEQVGRSERVKEGDHITTIDPMFMTLINSFAERGDMIVNRVMQFAAPDGSMSEQIDASADGVTGLPKQRSAPKLTWSAAAFLRAAKARKILTQFVNSMAPGSHQPIHRYGTHG